MQVAVTERSWSWSRNKQPTGPEQLVQPRDRQHIVAQCIQELALVVARVTHVTRPIPGLRCQVVTYSLSRYYPTTYTYAEGYLQFRAL